MILLSDVHLGTLFQILKTLPASHRFLYKSYTQIAAFSAYHPETAASDAADALPRKKSAHIPCAMFPRQASTSNSVSHDQKVRPQKMLPDP